MMRKDTRDSASGNCAKTLRFEEKLRDRPVVRSYSPRHKKGTARQALPEFREGTLTATAFGSSEAR